MSLIWRVRLARQADADWGEIVRWTAKRFGAEQARRYAETLVLAIEALHEGPGVPGARARGDLGPNIRTLHVGRPGRPSRHFVVFRAAADAQVIEVLRLLHESMDLARHVPGEQRSAIKK